MLRAACGLLGCHPSLTGIDWKSDERRFVRPQSMCTPLFFFFSSRRRHTRFDCDWSSDVCSSDLQKILSFLISCLQSTIPSRQWQQPRKPYQTNGGRTRVLPSDLQSFFVRARLVEIGRASCRERV